MLIDTVTSACKIGAIKGKSGHRQHTDVSRHLWVTLYHGINLFIINSFLVLINNESIQIHLEYNHIAEIKLTWLPLLHFTIRTKVTIKIAVQVGSKWTHQRMVASSSAYCQIYGIPNQRKRSTDSYRNKHLEIYYNATCIHVFRLSYTVFIFSWMEWGMMFNIVLKSLISFGYALTL